MNIFLVPYTSMRHVVVGLYCGGAALLAWWLFLLWTVNFGPWWTPGWDGFAYLGTVSSVVAGASVMGECVLRRRSVVKRLLLPLLAMVISFFGSMAAFWLWQALLAPGLLAPLVAFCIRELSLFTVQLGEDFSDQQLELLATGVEADVVDASLVSLRYRLGGFVLVGFASAIGPAVVRRARGAISHLLAGVLAGLLAAATWYVFNRIISSDLYLAAALGAVVWGTSFGFFAWGLPDDLYAGWLRVLSASRFGRRIPIDAPDGAPVERFVGHFPRGLDLFVPIDDAFPLENQVQELHLSLAVDNEQRYVARGLHLAPTFVRRFLERVDLRYEETRPAPLETRITSGDRIVLGHGREVTELEFLMLPREER